MRSSFNTVRRRARASATPKVDETYNLLGLNLLAPDQVMPEGETPYALNNRRYAEDDEDTAVAMRTRKGSTIFSTPVGQSNTVSETGTVTSDISLTPGRIIAIPFTAADDNALTQLELYIKKAVNTRGYVVVEIYSNSSVDLPDQKLAQGSIAPSSITSSYADVASYFMDAPALTNGDDYWAIVYMQSTGVGTYYLGGVASGTVHTSDDGMETWLATTYGARFKVYTATAGEILGFTKRYPEIADNKTLFAMGTKLYEVSEAGSPTELGTDEIDAAANTVRFLNIDERTVWIDGVGNARWWDDDNPIEDVPNVPSANGVPVNGLFLENRLLVVPKGDQTRIDFSALYDFETWPATNFLYIGRPLSQDHITAMHEFREAATIFTKETKYTLTGTDIQTFEPIPHKGTKGAISQEATAVGVEGIYFLADDRNVYRWDGSRDVLISKKVHRELKKILDLDKVRFHLYNNQLRIYYNRNPDASVNRMLLFDITDGQWYMDTGREVVGSMEWVHDDNELVEFSSKCGWMFYGEESYSDLGKAIEFKYWTAYKNYGSGMSKDRIKRFRPVVRPAESQYYLQVGKDIDFKNAPVMTPWLVDSGGAKWGSFNWGDGTTYGGSKIVDEKVAMSGRGKHTQFRFEHDGIEQPVYLLGYMALIKSGRRR